MAASKGKSNKWIRGLVVGAAAAAIGLVLFFTGALDGPENTTWDLRVRQLHRPTSATDDVVVVFVDQIDLDILAENNSIGWPWPRSVYAYIVDFVAAANAASLTFDVILEDEGSWTWQDDQLLQYSAQMYGRTIFGAELRGFIEQYDEISDEESAAAEEWPPYISRPQLTVEGLETLPAPATENIAALEASFPYEFVIPPNGTLAFVNQANDSDGVFRRYRLVNFHIEQPLPALALAPLVANEPVTARFEGNWLDVNGTRVPLNDEGKFLLRYTADWDVPTTQESEKPPTERSAFLANEIIYSWGNILSDMEPSIPLAALEGKHVLVGLSASGLYDLRPTPLNEAAPGVTVHATALDNLLSGEFMRDLPVWGSVLLIVLLSMAAAMAATYASGTIAEALIFIGFIALLFGLTFGGYLIGLWVPLVVPLVAVVLAVATGNIANYATEGAQKRFIRGAFSQYLSPDVITQLEANPESLDLVGREMEISIYFSDIQKFSTISKDLGDAAKLTDFLNDYLTPMTDIIMEEGGTIDKYEGDAIIAFWGAPIEQPDHAQRALRSVMRCQAKLDELRDHFREQIGKDVFQRIGLNTGIATVGNLGSRQRFDYTMIGDSVNLAARLEGANKAFGTYTMVSEDTLKETGPLYPVRELGNIGVVGREDRPVRVFEPMTQSEYDKRSSVLQRYEEAYKLFYDGHFAEAKPLFAAIAEADPAAASYVSRCEEMIANPPAQWNGIWVLTEKG
jgi:adenylate cyclase